MKRVTQQLRRLAHLIKRVAGMPDYERYVAHMRTHHAGCAVASEREFHAMYLKGRYEGGANRCC